jgi:hypothetical protein
VTRVTLLSITAAKNCSNETLHVLNYLSSFGCFSAPENAIRHVDATNLTNATLIFQEYYGLDPTAQKTTPRFGVHDDVFSFSTTTYKWNKKIVTWHYALANQEVLDIT